MYEMETTVPFTKTGADNRLKLHEAVGMMMDCSQFQEYQEKAFCDYLRSNGLAIFLFSIQIDILRMPGFRETVKTAVKIYGCKSIYGLRRFTMRDEAGRICLLANATGAFFDIRAGRAVKLDPASFQVKFDEAEPMECLPRKIPVPAGEGVCTDPFEVKRSCLDPNGHLTSAVYFAVAEDALPENFLFNRVRVEYRRQAKPREKILPFLHDCGGGVFAVDMKSGDGGSFAVAEFSSADLSAEADV